MVERCGVSALTVHGRRREERPVHANRNAEIREIRRALSIPVIANGGSRGMHSWREIEEFRKETECNSVMVARAAQVNPSVFRREGPLPPETVIKDYLIYATDYDAHPSNVKYVIQRMLGDQQTTTERGRALLSSVTLRQMCRLYGLEEYYLEAKGRQRDRAQRDRRVRPGDEGHLLLANLEIVEEEVAIPKKNFLDSSPKYVLGNWCRQRGCDVPSYQTVTRAIDKRFRSVVSVDGKLYSSSFWERNKKFSEHAAAMVALNKLGLTDMISADFWDQDYKPK